MNRPDRRKIRFVDLEPTNHRNTILKRTNLSIAEWLREKFTNSLRFFWQADRSSCHGFFLFRISSSSDNDFICEKIETGKFSREKWRRKRWFENDFIQNCLWNAGAEKTAWEGQNTVFKSSQSAFAAYLKSKESSTVIERPQEQALDLSDYWGAAYFWEAPGGGIIHERYAEKRVLIDGHFSGHRSEPALSQKAFVLPA